MKDKAMKRGFRLFACVVPLAVVASVTGAAAQNVAGQGTNWSGSYGFSSATDKSVKLNQAQIIRQAEEAVDPTTNYYTYNTNTTDNRSNYNETVSGDGDVSVQVVGGDSIGQKTYSVGSLNTGSTEITISGDGNFVDANNSATTNGCVDGSVSSLSFEWTPTDGSAGATGVEPNTTRGLWDMNSASLGGGCQ